MSWNFTVTISLSLLSIPPHSKNIIAFVLPLLPHLMSSTSDNLIGSNRISSSICTTLFSYFIDFFEWVYNINLNWLITTLIYSCRIEYCYLVMFVLLYNWLVIMVYWNLRKLSVYFIRSYIYVWSLIKVFLIHLQCG